MGTDSRKNPTCFIYTINPVFRVTLEAISGYTTGFKYCNIASATIEDHWIKIESENPFYLEKGVQCDMPVPKHCRRLPVEHMYALPLSNQNRCEAIPIASDLNNNEFCRYVDKELEKVVEVEEFDPIANTTIWVNQTIVYTISEPIMSHSSDEMCMYCVVGNERTATGLLTMEWSTCGITCKDGEIVSCECTNFGK